MEQSELVLYKSEDGTIKVDVLFQEETVWLTQQQMADLFQKDRSVITRHISNLFDEGELDRNSVCAKIAHTAADGKTYDTTYYNLDVIISVGYRVKSRQGTQFRMWATQRLRDYIIKGFALNDERFTTGSSMNYFKELLDRIRAIRLSEKVFYQQIKDIYATSIDYNPSDELTLAFYREVQNKLLWAVSGKTAAELIYYRANADLPMMGLTSTAIEGKVRKTDVSIGKNYLSEEEIGTLKLVVEQFLAFAEVQAMQHKPMYMKDWIAKLRLVLTMNEKNVLECAGTISHELAVSHAETEYKKFKAAQRLGEHLESIRQLDADLKALERAKK